MKMPSPKIVVKIRRDHTACVFAFEKLHALAATHEGAIGPCDQDLAPLNSCQRGSPSAACVQPSDNEGIHVKANQIGTDATQTTCITGDLGDK
jgi:hypothetical protein